MTFIEKFNIHSKKKIVVLIAPLDWGLGHASRCIPIIKHLLSIHCEIVIAADGIQRSMLEREFPDLRYENLPGYRVTFSKNRVKTLMKLVVQIPKILMSINRETAWLKQYTALNNIDLIISDNRYGLYTPNICSVFITHQLNIKTGFGNTADKLLRFLNYSYINKFTECWVPDYQGQHNFGGALSHPSTMPSIPLQYLGRLSRITEKPVTQSLNLLIILSGPEPQRTILENLLLERLKVYTGKHVLVRGLPGETKMMRTNSKHLVIHNHLSGEQLNRQIIDSGIIISRSGYSTVMDLIGRNKRCIFVPTPGQAEQEYLAKYLASKKLCLSYLQESFDLETALDAAASFEFESFGDLNSDQYKIVLNNLVRILREKS